MLLRKKYKSGKITVISDVELTQKQVEKIVDIVNEVMGLAFYESCYHISRNIFHEIKDQISSIHSVTTKSARGKLKIRLSIKER